MRRFRKMNDEVLVLREQGKSYREICELLDCSKGTVSYICGKGQKKKTRDRGKKNRTNNPLLKKIHCFSAPSKIFSKLENSKLNFLKNLYTRINYFCKGSGGMLFTTDQLMNKIGENPICYLSGRKIDINSSRSYNLDHILPRNRGGDNSLENCNIIDSVVNRAKRDSTNEEFIAMCKEIIEHNGYKCIKK